MSHERVAKLDAASDSLTFLHALDRLWKEILEQPNISRVKKIGVTFFHLAEPNVWQPELFEAPTDDKLREKAGRLSNAMDLINQRYGKDSILLGIVPKAGQGFSGTKIAFTRVPDSDEFSE